MLGDVSIRYLKNLLNMLLGEEIEVLLYLSVKKTY